MDEETRHRVYQAAKRMGRAYLTTAVDEQPWVRPVQPAWDGNDLVIATWQGSPKIRHIQQNPRVQLFYEVDEAFQHLRVTGLAETVDDLAEKRRLWNCFEYDLTPYFGAPDAPTFTLIRVRSTRIDLAADAGTGKEQPLIWRRDLPGDPSSSSTPKA
ncbi:MAG: hypothetical protein EPO21_07840 [Chloroflexota bacterium]|nr:MAG: hypothetical protein EPO21_07840 [Chloroflexota bacterium]